MSLSRLFCIAIFQLVSIYGFASSHRQELVKISNYFDGIKAGSKFSNEVAEEYLKKSLEIRSDSTATLEEKIDALIIYASICGKIVEKNKFTEAHKGKLAYAAVNEAIHLDPANCNANYAFGNSLRNMNASFFMGAIESYLKINIRSESCRLVSDANFRNCKLEDLEIELNNICK